MSLSNEPLLENKDKKILNKKIEKYVHKGDVLNSNFINRLFFYWAYKTIKVIIWFKKLANITPLKSEHLGKLEGKNRSQEFLKEFLYFWEVKDYQKLEKLKIFKTAFPQNWY